MLPFPDTTEIALFALVMGRIGGILSAIPMFGGKTVPMKIKVVLVFAMTLVFFPLVRAGLPQIPMDTVSLALLVIKEALVGITLGLLAQVIFSAVEFFGQIVGMQMGFTISSQFDPAMGTQTSVMATLQNMLAMLLFLSLGMHHLFIRAIVESYHVVPLGAWHMSTGLYTFVVTVTGQVFILAIKLAAPVMASLLAATMALGVMARTFPQMNIFMMSFPLNIGLGFLVLGVTLMAFFHTLGNMFSSLDGQITTLFRLIGS